MFQAPLVPEFITCHFLSTAWSPLAFQFTLLFFLWFLPLSEQVDHSTQPLLNNLLAFTELSALTILSGQRQQTALERASYVCLHGIKGRILENPLLLLLIDLCAIPSLAVSKQNDSETGHRCGAWRVQSHSVLCSEALSGLVGSGCLSLWGTGSIYS